MGKMNEILCCSNVDHYKNLRKPLEGYKRVHIKGSSVLLFKYVPQDNKIIFYIMEHHDSVYR